ncbi:ATP-binding cassette domain-containing protein [Nonomuraea sp. NPDC049714]|uniref:ATP-binding cassette domain-containing protein n=1 Tax=Nonomuraea sp. NPDC049714 TaxID=3364357 RepID=UPI0037ABA162
MIEVRDLQVRYGTRVVARVPELDVSAGECVAIVGESGSGKSTTLLSLLGLTEGAEISGYIRVCGVEVLQASARRLREIRGARVALVMQSPQAALSPTTRLGTLMRRALKLHGIAGPPVGDTRDGDPAARGPAAGGSGKGGLERVMAEAVEAVMLDPEILRRYPHEISGGQAQRFAIALAIALGAEVILADEPTSALDVTVQAEVVGVLRRLREQRGLALLLVSHDLALVSTIADRVLVMKDGEVVESGPAAEVLAHPSHPYTRELLEALP